jgi:hypothetical protein
MVSRVSRRDTKEFEPLPVILMFGAATFAVAAFVYFRSADLLTGAVFLCGGDQFSLQRRIVVDLAIPPGRLSREETQ